jgi:hypothetical protein
VDELSAAFERLKRLPQGQARGAAREISAYLTHYPEYPFAEGRSFEQLSTMIENLQSDDRTMMIDQVKGLAERFELANHVRATGEFQYFRIAFDLDRLRIPDWPQLEYCEVVGDYVIRMAWRMGDGALLKNSVDSSWSEGLVTLRESAPSVGAYSDVAVVEHMGSDAFEAIWAEAEFVGKEGDQAWEAVDTTVPTDPSFEPVLGAWMAADGSGEVIEFTLNGIVLWSRPDTPMRFFRYIVEGGDVRLDPETGQPAVRFVLQGDVLMDETSRRFVRD